jgi:hypothetical protein
MSKLQGSDMSELPPRGDMSLALRLLLRLHRGMPARRFASPTSCMNSSSARSRRGVYPKRFPIPVLAQEFNRMVGSNGRITELLLVMRLFLKPTSPR